MRICDVLKDKSVFKLNTRAALVVYCFSEIDSSGIVVNLTTFQEVNRACGLSKSSYYRGIKELEKEGLVVKLNTNCIQNETSKESQNETNKQFQNETPKKTPDFNSFLNNQPTVSKSNTVEEVHTEKDSTLKDLLYMF